MDDTLEDLKPAGRVAELHHLAEYADDLLVVLETIEESMWSLADLHDLASALDSLSDHRDTLERLSELDRLADDVGRLARAVRESRRHRDELGWAIEELEDPQQDES